jgi:hypothetical protein
MLKWPFGALFLKFELAGSQKRTIQKMISVSARFKLQTIFKKPYKKRKEVLVNDYICQFRGSKGAVSLLQGTFVTFQRTLSFLAV